MNTVHLVVCVAVCLMGASAQLYDGMFRKLMRGYAKDVMPRRNVNNTLGVKFNLQLIQIQDLSFVHQLLRTELWVSMQWRDRRLSWTPSDYGDVEKIAIPPNKLWIPDIVLFNGNYFHHSELNRVTPLWYWSDGEVTRGALGIRGGDIRAMVYNDGTVYLIRPAVVRTRCDVAQGTGTSSTCQLKFGSWVHSGNELDLDFQTDEKEMDLSDYVASYDYEVMANTAVRNLAFYDCCPEPYVDLTYTIEVNRVSRRKR